MSTSQYKTFKQCETLALAEIQGKYTRPESIALLVGSYVDAHFSNELNKFTRANPSIFKKDGSLKSDFEQANEIIARIERDKLFLAAISGKAQKIMTGSIEGVPFKVKIDSLLPDMTVDLKVMRDMSDVYINGEWQPFWKAWGYHYQAAIYQEIRRQNDGVRKPFGLAVATKEKPEPDLALLMFPQSELDLALEEIRSDVTYFDMIKQKIIEPERCETCAVCRKTKILTGWTPIT